MSDTEQRDWRDVLVAAVQAERPIYAGQANRLVPKVEGLLRRINNEAGLDAADVLTRQVSLVWSDDQGITQALEQMAAKHLTAREDCTLCDGSGKAPNYSKGGELDTCSSCNGLGEKKPGLHMLAAQIKDYAEAGLRIGEDGGPEGFGLAILSTALAFVEWEDLARGYCELVEESWEFAAKEAGEVAAKNAASWTVDGGKATPDGARNVLRMLEDGDPAAEQYLPAQPNLSSEYADDPSPASVFEEVVGNEPDALDAEVVSQLADAWEAGVTAAFEPACERELLKFAEVD